MSGRVIVKRKVTNRLKPTEKTYSAFDAYTQCPAKELRLSEYRDICERRLSVLKWVESQAAIDFGDALKTEFRAKLNKKGLFVASDVDKISHFMLRLGHCRSKEKRDWFIDQERKLFEFRWEFATQEQKAIVVRELTGKNDGLNSTAPIQLNKDECIRHGLSAKYPIPVLVTGSVGPLEKHILPIHKVPFYEVPDLVGRRAVYIQEGYAYIPNDLFKSYITGKYRAALSSSLNVAAHRFEELAEGQSRRIMSIVNQIGSLTRGPVYSAENSEQILKPRDVPKVAAKHFPLCMRVMERQVKHDSHLKHKGRLYYGKFLKGCGMTCDDQISYFRRIFTKKMAAEKWDKEYRYSIRHHYGLEGRKKNYSPQGCVSLMSEAPGPGEYHGCPYKVFDSQNLTRLLRSFKTPDVVIKQVVEKAEAGHHQLACRELFAFTNKKHLVANNMDVGDIENTWAHPNSYYNASCKLLGEKTAGDATVGDTKA